jgi:hypothetical protein
MTAQANHTLSIREQTLDDPVSGFVFKFVFVPGSENPSRVLFKKSNEITWREYVFDTHGDFGGATTRAAAGAGVPVQPTLRLVK